MAQGECLSGVWKGGARLLAHGPETMYPANTMASTVSLQKLKKHCPAAFYRPNTPAPDDWIQQYGGMPGTRSTGDQPFFESDKKVRISCGGNRAGKTTKLILECGAAAVGFRPWYSMDDQWFTRGLWTPAAQKRGYLRARYILPSFESHMADLMAGFKFWWPKSWWKVESKTPQGQPRSIRFFNGSEIIFMSHHMKQEDFEGTESDLVAFDEPPPEWMWSRTFRGTTSTGGRVIVGATLLDASGWFWDTVMARAEGDLERDIDVFWHSIWDNTVENGSRSDQRVEAVRQFLEIGVTSVEERLAREHGYPMHVGGLILSGFSKRNEVDPFELPEDCVIAAGIDPAGSRPFAGLHIAYFEDERGWVGHVFDETFLPQQKNDLGAFARLWREKEEGKTWPRHPSKSVLTVIDPFSEEPQKADRMGRSIRRILDEDFGISTVLANRQGKRGRLLQLNTRIADCRYKVWRNCKHLLMERRRWSWDPDNAKLTRGPDDLCDCWTYIDASDPHSRFGFQLTEAGGVWIPPEYREKKTRLQIAKERFLRFGVSSKY